MELAEWNYNARVLDKPPDVLTTAKLNVFND